MELKDIILIKKENNYNAQSLIDSREFELNQNGFKLLENMLLKSNPNQLLSSQELFLYSQFSDFIKFGNNFKPRIHNGRLSVISIENNKNCNLECKHCYLGIKENHKLSTFIFRSLVDSSKNLGAYSLAITGGEPFLDKDLFKKISYARDQDFKISISSNGIPLNQDKIGKLKELKVSGLTITFLGNQEDHELIYGIDTYSRTVKTLELIKESGIELSINYLLYKKNYSYFESIVSKINLDFEPKSINTTYISNKGNAKNNPQFLLSQKEIKDFLQRFNVLTTAPNILQHVECGLNCEAGNKSIFIKSNGDVVPCVEFCSYSLGNVNTQSLEDILSNNSRIHKLNQFDIRKIDKCRNCNSLNQCQGGCRGKSYEITGDLYGLEENACLLYN